MMTTLPSPPLSPMDSSYTSSNLLTTAPNPKSSYRKKGHLRHPPRRHDTFELIQALVIEHQRLEQQEYETMLRDIPSISCRNTANAPKGILVNNKKSIGTTVAPRTVTTTTTTTLNNSLPQSPHDTNDHPRSTTTSSAHHYSTQRQGISDAYSPSSSSIGSSVSSSPSTSSLTSSSMAADSYSSHITRHVVRFAPGPPKVYTYQRIPILQES